MAKINLDFWKVCLLNWFEDLLCPKVASFLDLCVSSKHEGMESFWLKVVKVVKFPAQRLIVFNVLIVQTPHSIMLMRPDWWPASDHTTDSPQHNLTHTHCVFGKFVLSYILLFIMKEKSFLAISWSIFLPLPRLYTFWLVKMPSYSNNPDGLMCLPQVWDCARRGV